MRKPWVSLTIDKQLLDKVDNKRREISVKEQKDVSRSAFISELIEKGLQK